MRSAVIYSSLTGNTRSVAEAVLAEMPPGCAIYPISAAPDPAELDLLALGFWVSKSGPDPKMAAYMQRLQGKSVGLFGTMAGYPGSPYGEKVRANAEALLAGNRALGTFLCMGRISQKRLEGYLDGTLTSKKHPMTAERKVRLLEAAQHPTSADFASAREAFRLFLQKVENDD